MTAESRGVRLKRLRLEKGLSLEEVHKKTKIHLSVLKAIEEDSLTNFNPVYMRGFLKIYCKFLGAEPREFIPDYQEPQTDLHEIFARRLKEESFLKSVALTTVSLLGNKKVRRALIVIVILIFAFSLSKAIFRRRPSLSFKRERPSVAAVQKKSTQEAQALKASSQTRAPAVKEPLASIIRLGIYAREDCWILLRSDGKVVFQNILKKGRFESWQAKEKLEFSLGNAGVVDLEINSKRIPALGRRGQVIKSIVITKEGLRTP